jgi:hypothetical protein
VAGKISLSQYLILSLYTLISAFLAFLKPKQEIQYTKRVASSNRPLKNKKNMSTIWQVKLKCDQNNRVQHATVRETWLITLYTSITTAKSNTTIP